MDFDALFLWWGHCLGSVGGVRVVYLDVCRTELFNFRGQESSLTALTICMAMALVILEIGTNT